MEKKILITGGLGFIGSNILRYLLKTTNFSFVILDKETYAGRKENIPSASQYKKRIHLIKGDVTKRRIVRKSMENISIVIHMAADTHTSRSIHKPLKTIHTNVMGTIVILEEASKHKLDKFIFISSSEVYGNQIEGLPMDENHPLNPVTPYAASKLAGDRLAYSFFLTKNLPVVILRFFNAYGPMQHTEKAIPRFITSLLENKPIILLDSGKQARDWVYVEDHARAIEKVLKADAQNVVGEVFNIGTGKANSVANITKYILRELQKNSSFVKIILSNEKGTDKNVGISKKAKKVLDWESKVTVEEGIKKTVDWYRKNKIWWKSLKNPDKH